MLEENKNKNINDEQKEQLKDSWQTFMSDNKEGQPTEVQSSLHTQPQPTESIQKPPKSSKKVIVILIVLFILLGLGAGGYFIYSKYSNQIQSIIYPKKEETKEEVKQQDKDDNDQIVKDMKKKAEIAQKEVQKKYTDAYLYSVDVYYKVNGVKKFWLEDDRDLKSYKNSYIFGFSSKSAKKNISVVIGISSQKNKIIDVNEDSDDLGFPALPIQNIKISYKKALKIADISGGKKFINENSNVEQQGPGITSAFLDIDPNSLGWDIRYVVYGKDIKSINFLINAKNGKIIHKSKLKM
jgi:hypothetical protein